MARLEPKREEQVVKMLLAGKKQREIIEETGVAGATIIRIKRKYGMKVTEYTNRDVPIEKYCDAEMREYMKTFRAEWEKAVKMFDRVEWVKNRGEGVRVVRRA